MGCSFALDASRKLLRLVEDEQRSLVIEKRGTARAVLLSIRDYVRLAARDVLTDPRGGLQSEWHEPSQFAAY
jgi:prevent-host-death family protein